MCLSLGLVLLCLIQLASAGVPFPNKRGFVIDYTDIPLGKETHDLNCSPPKTCSAYATIVTGDYTNNIVFMLDGKVALTLTDLARSNDDGEITPVSLSGKYTIVNRNAMSAIPQPYFIYVALTENETSFAPVYEASKLSRFTFPKETDIVHILSDSPAFSLHSFNLSASTSLAVYASGEDEPAYFYAKGDRWQRTTIAILSPIVTVQIDQNGTATFTVDQTDRRNGTILDIGDTFITMSPGFSGVASCYANPLKAAEQNYTFRTPRYAKFVVNSKLYNANETESLDIVDGIQNRTSITSEQENTEILGNSLLLQWLAPPDSEAQFVTEIVVTKASSLASIFTSIVLVFAFIRF